MKHFSIGALCVLLFTGVFAQEKWDVSKPNSPFKEVSFDLNEGTWLNLDISPDGKQIVFDLLGDIYTMPADGGKATLLRGGYAYEVQPRFSPDGSKISFTSDAGGGDNIWTMNADGSSANQITKETFRLLNNAVWTPDGNYLIARKHFTSERSLGAGELWMYHSSGGSGIQLNKRKNNQQDLGEPSVSPDGRYVYYSEDVYDGGYFKYNKDPNSQIYVIKRFDREEGKIETIINGPGGAVRPQLSPDGTKLSFVRRVRTKSVLFVHDLATGVQKAVYQDLSKDQQEAWAIFGVYSNYNWFPDNIHVAIWSKGKIHKINTTTGADKIIPFQVNSAHKITDALVFEQNPLEDKVEIKVIRQATTSPNGKTLAFSAVGHIWIKQLPNGKPKRLTNSDHFEYDPAFSPDGKSLTYVTWSDREKGAIMKSSIKGGTPIQLTTEKGIYRSPSFSPNGTKIVYNKESGNAAFGFSYGIKPGIYTISSSGGEAIFISEEGAFPKFNKDGKRIFFQKGGKLFGYLNKEYCSVDLNGSDKKVHFHASHTNQYAISPNEEWIAFGELHQVYIMPFATTGKTFELTSKTTALPVKKLSSDAGINLHWSSDNKKVLWTLGSQYFGANLKDAFTFLPDAPDSIGTVKTDSIQVNLMINSDQPTGIIALVNAKIITMDNDKIIEKGIIIIEGNKIKAIGDLAEIPVPKGAKVYSLEGKTIMPGLVDTHAHLRAFRGGMNPQQDWPYFANLAFGITTTHDPSANSEMVFSQSEMVKTGYMVGPRIFSTGTILYGAEGDFKAIVNNIDDARMAIRRTKAYGAFSVKSYNQPRRDQRQQVIQASREEGIMVYPEGGSTFFHNMTMILDGHTSIEHNIPIAPLYQDVVSLWAASGTSNTPTLIVNYGGLNGEYYWYQKTNVWENKKLLKYTPRAIVDSRARHRTMVPDEEYENGHILVSKSCKKLVDAGVKICVGGHGQLQGLGVHWEMWNLSQGGMTNMEVLKAATIHGAEYIGMDKSLGSLSVGKLADIIVLEKNPLENIRHTELVTYTMVNGRLYETATMNEIGNTPKERLPFFWEQEGYNENFQWHENTHSFENSKCHCHQH